MCNKEPANGVANVAFSPQRLQRLQAMEEHHFWFRGRWLVVQRLLHKTRAVAAGPVADIGCGTGFTAALVRSLGFRVVALDPLWEGLLAARRRSNLPLVQADGEQLPFRPRSLTGALLLDVLEHVSAEQVLKQVWQALRPGGFLIFSVPAMPWLWSSRDEGAGHRCRYTRSKMKHLLSQTGFAVHEIRSYLSLLLPLVLVSRLLARIWPTWERLEERPWPLANALGNLVTRLEVELGRWVSWPVGSSLVGLACKPRQGDLG